MLLPKTLQSLQSIQKEVIKDTLQSALHTDGVDITRLDIVFGHYFIYVLLSDGILMPVFLYKNCISYKQSQIYGLPKIHFCVCDKITNDLNAIRRVSILNEHNYIAKISNKNAFSVSIKQGSSEMGLYHHYPLELCGMCSDILEQLRQGEVIDSTLGVYVFSHKWLYLLESQSSIRQKEILALQSNNLTCYKCKKPITLDCDVWIQIEKGVVKIYCC